MSDKPSASVDFLPQKLGSSKCRVFLVVVRKLPMLFNVVWRRIFLKKNIHEHFEEVPKNRDIAGTTITSLLLRVLDVKKSWQCGIDT